MNDKTETQYFNNMPIPKGWEVKELGEVAKIFVGRDLKENNFSSFKTDEFRFPVYSNTVENEGLYGFYNIEEYSGESLTIVGRGAGLGTAFTRNGSYGAIGRLLVLFPKNEINGHYITEYVNNKLNIHQESGGIPQLTGEQIANYKIVLPKYIEQKAIAQVLSTMDKAIQLTKQLIVQKEQRKKWLMQNLLTGRKRLRGYEGAWKVGTLEEITILCTNGFVGKATDSYDETDEGILYIQGYNILENGFNFNGIKKVKKAFHEKNKKSQLKEDDLLTIQTGDVGVTAIVPKQLEGSNCHALVISRFKKEIANPKFFHQFFNSTIGRKLLKVIETGSTMKHLNVGDMIYLKLPLPSIEEQTAIAQILQTADKEIGLLKAKAAQLRELKRGAMQVLLTGRKRLKINTSQKE